MITPVHPSNGQLYWPGAANRCPGCHGQQWLVGRVAAECPRCATALPLASASHQERVAA